MNDPEDDIIDPAEATMISFCWLVGMEGDVTHMLTRLAAIRSAIPNHPHGSLAAAEQAAEILAYWLRTALVKKKLK